MPILDINLFGDAYEIFNTIYPKGFVYPQYPGQKSPNEMWGDFSTWEVIDYHGAFFRTAGGNAEDFEKTLEISEISGRTVTFSSEHNLSVGSIIYDSENNEGRVITSVTNATTVVIDVVFTSANITSVYVSQNQGTSKNGLKLNSKSDMSGTDNTSTGMSAHKTHRHNLIVGGSGGQGDDGTNSFIVDWTTDVSVVTMNTSRNHTNDVDLEHNHSIYLGSNDNETRGVNYTYRLWRRID